MTSTAEPFPIEPVLALLAAALRGDEEGTRLLVDLLPGSQLREAVHLLVRMLAGAITRGSGLGDLPAALLSGLLADLAEQEGGA